VTVTALAAYFFLNTSQSAWLVWTALLLAHISSGENLFKQLQLIFFTGLIAALTVFIAGCGLFIILLAVCLFVFTLFCMWVSEQYPQYFLPAFIINFFLVLASSLPLHLGANSERSISILLGTGIVILWQVVCWPYSKQSLAKRLIKRTLLRLQRLNQDIFSCYLQEEFPTQLYVYERRLHQQKNQVMRCFALLQTQGKCVTDCTKSLAALYDIMLGYASIRWQETDHSTFALCAEELKALAKEMDAVFQQLIKGKDKLNTAMLTMKLTEFEQHFQTVLNVTAREPLLFLLFIFYIKSFITTLNTEALTRSFSTSGEPSC